MSDSDKLKEFADYMTSWYESRAKALDDVIEATGNGKPLKIGDNKGGEEVTLEGDKLSGFRAGMLIARQLLGSVPFTLEDNSSDDLGLDDDEPEEEPAPVPPRPSEFGHFS
jgi:hypothetical protein